MSNPSINDIPNLTLLHFTQNADVINAIRDIEAFIAGERAKDPTFSYSDDLVEGDENGIWNVDLVQEGGGVLGIALVGFTYVLEKVGFRFKKLGGTSVGAINTLLMATAVGTKEKSKSEVILEELKDMDFLQFIDGRSEEDKSVKEFVASLINARTTPSWSFLKRLRFYYETLGVWDDFKHEMGLNRGDSFENWLKAVLAKESFGKVDSLEKLLIKMGTFSEAEFADVVKENQEIELWKKCEAEKAWPMAVIAADITSETKAVFPRDAYLYDLDPFRMHPAEFVRASMSVPFFFYPKKFNVPYQGANDDQEEIQARKDWYEKLIRGWREKKEIPVQPDEAILVDGGIISNFPIDIFHISDNIPSRPTFGVKLGIERKDINILDESNTFNAFPLLSIIFKTARLARDRDFIKSNQDFQNLVAYIDTGDHDWLNFFLTNRQKVDLFARGAKAACEFLTNKFNWQDYKNVRKELLLRSTRNIMDSNANSMLEKAFRGRSNSKIEIESDPTTYGAVPASYERGSVATNQNLEATDEPIPKKPDTSWEEQKRVLSQRVGMIKLIKDVDQQEDVFKVLWVDDKCKSDNYFKSNELDFIQEVIGAEITKVTNSADAEAYLRNNSYDYDLIISDIERPGGNGIEFLNKLVNAVHDGTIESLPPLIFYISVLDKSKGIPPYSFNITNKVSELMHLIADVYERKGLYRYTYQEYVSTMQREAEKGKLL